MPKRLSETLRESAASLKFGTIDQIDEVNYLVKVRLDDLDMVTHWLPVMARNTFKDQDYDIPEKDTLVVILLDPSGEDGVVLGALYSEEDMPPVQSKAKWHKAFEDGAFIEYDKVEHKLTVDSKGDIKIDATGKVTLTAQGDITIESVTGQLKIKSLLPLTVESQSTTTIKAAAEIDLDAPLINAIGFLKILGGIG